MKRQPEGIPTGGQFAADRKGEPVSLLSGDPLGDGQDRQTMGGRPLESAKIGSFDSTISRSAMTSWPNSHTPIEPESWPTPAEQAVLDSLKKEGEEANTPVEPESWPTPAEQAVLDSMTIEREQREAAEKSALRNKRE